MGIGKISGKWRMRSENVDVTETEFQINGWVPRDFWLEHREKQTIVGFHPKTRWRATARRRTFLMLDAESWR